MTTQLKAVHLAASGQVSLAPGRLRNLSAVGGAASGTLTLIDGSTNGSGGTVIAVLDISTGTGGPLSLELVGLGLRFNTNLYCTFGSTAPVGATFFIG